MAIIKIKTTIRNSMAQQIMDALDGGTGPAKLKFYTGTIPADGDTAITTQTLLGTLICTDPSAVVTSGVVIFDDITQDNAADASGAAAFAALTDSDDAVKAYLDVTATGGGGAITLNTVTIVQGGPILMTSLAITVGA
jgi:hypothetical protein